MVLKVRKVTEERKAHRGREVSKGRKETLVLLLLLVLVPPHKLGEDRREKKVQRVILASDTPAIKATVGLQGLLGPLVLLDPQLRWSVLEMALLCRRWLDPLDLQDHRGQMGLPDLQELMENLVIQERTEKLVLLGHKASQEVQELLVLKAKRVIVEKVNLDPEAPQVHQDLLGLAPVTAQRLLTWRDQDSQTWTKSGVFRVFQVPQALQALLGTLVLL